MFISFCRPNKSENKLKIQFQSYKCHETPIDVENCVKNAVTENLRKLNFMKDDEDYQLRSALAAKHIWVAVITS